MEEEATTDVKEGATLTRSDTSTLRSTHESGMSSSVFRFKDVNFVVPSKHGDKVVLHNVSGTVKWGHVLAIMGPSGAGKVCKNMC